MDDFGFEFWQRQEIFRFSKSSRSSLAFLQPLIQWILGCSFPWVKRPRRDVDHSPPASAVTGWNCTATPARCLHGMARNNLNLYAFYKSYFGGSGVVWFVRRLPMFRRKLLFCLQLRKGENLLPCLVETLQLVYILYQLKRLHTISSWVFTVDLPIILSSCSVILFQI
jgi:hypothetical protein